MSRPRRSRSSIREISPRISSRCGVKTRCGARGSRSSASRKCAGRPWSRISRERSSSAADASGSIRRPAPSGASSGSTRRPSVVPSSLRVEFDTHDKLGMLVPLEMREEFRSFGGLEARGSGVARHTATSAASAPARASFRNCHEGRRRVPRAVLSSRRSRRRTSKPSLEQLLDRMGAYLVEYETQLSSVVAEERFEQSIFAGHGGRDRQRCSNQRSRLSPPRRRGVARVSRRQARELEAGKDGGPSIGEVLTSAAGDMTKARRLQESARHNLGLPRTINVPTAPLDIIHPMHRAAHRYELQGEETVRGTRTARHRVHGSRASDAACASRSGAEPGQQRAHVGRTAIRARCGAWNGSTRRRIGRQRAAGAAASRRL